MDISMRPQLHTDWIDKEAIRIVHTLQKAGHESYLVGGCVRDLLAGISPKDFDIATGAHPQEVKHLIPRSYIIGKRFRLVLVKRGSVQYEVATFRRNPKPDECDEDNTDNLFGTPKEDACRRDFRINGLFYNPIKNETLDYCKGLEDIKNRVVQMIGNPKERLSEDPIRILRALRLAHKLDFTIEPELRKTVVECVKGLKETALPRRREELLKILKLKDPSLAFHEAHDLGILQEAFPRLAQVYESSESLEIFDHYLCRWNEMDLDPSDPSELFSALILAYVRSIIENEPDSPLTTLELVQNENLKLLMRDELGMSNWEQNMALSAIQLQSDLIHMEEFKKKSKKRQIGFLRNEALPMGLLLARIDHTISPMNLSFWHHSLEQAQPEIERLNKEREKKRNYRKAHHKTRASKA